MIRLLMLFGFVIINAAHSLLSTLDCTLCACAFIIITFYCVYKKIPRKGKEEKAKRIFPGHSRIFH
jgi:hypothetical protein